MRRTITILTCRHVVRLFQILLSASLLPSAVSAGEDVFTPLHVARLRSVSSAEISPDGEHIAYLLSVPRRPFVDENGSTWTELHVVDQQGHSRPFITGEVKVGSIAWTPDGKAISFLAKRNDDKHKSVYVIPLAGGEARKVLEHETDISRYEWNPDGSQIAFVAAEKEPKEKKKLKKKGFNARAYEEDLRMNKLWISAPNAASSSWDRDENIKPQPVELLGSASTIRWSPDGGHLAVALAPTPLIDDHYMQRKVRIVDAVKRESIIELDSRGKLGQVEWAPDGKHLALIAGIDINDPAAGRLMIANLDDSTLHNILPDYMGHVSAIAWQNAGTVMFVGDEGVWSTFGRIGMDGAGRKTILERGKYVLHGLSLSKDGESAAFTSDSPRHPAEVFAMRHGETTPRRLTNSNPWLGEMRLAPREVVTYKARDGVEIEGLLMRPLDAKPGQRYPLIVVVHGGPEAHYRNGWMTAYSRPGEVFAAGGFAVFYPNYRGSTGRGVKFTKMHQNDYAGKEFDDVVDGVDHLISIGLVDKDRVGVTGGSYGGFASAWCATYYSERFAASVMFVGISDQVSKFGTTDIPNEMYLVHSRRWPWEDWDYFRERSPVYHFQKCRTPILIMHGEDDTRVHPSQSMELYRYLKTYGKVPVRLVFYPGEGHGNRKAASRLDYSMRLVRWMEHYLKGAGGDPPPYELDYSGVKPEDSSKSEDDD